MRMRMKENQRVKERQRDTKARSAIVQLTNPIVVNSWDDTRSHGWCGVTGTTYPADMYALDSLKRKRHSMLQLEPPQPKLVGHEMSVGACASAPMRKKAARPRPQKTTVPALAAITSVAATAVAMAVDDTTSPSSDTASASSLASATAAASPIASAVASANVGPGNATTASPQAQGPVKTKAPAKPRAPKDPNAPKAPPKPRAPKDPNALKAAAKPQVPKENLAPQEAQAMGQDKGRNTMSSTTMPVVDGAAPVPSVAVPSILSWAIGNPTSAPLEALTVAPLTQGDVAMATM
jgi:hypothetical protein